MIFISSSQLKGGCHKDTSNLAALTIDFVTHIILKKQVAVAVFIK